MGKRLIATLASAVILGACTAEPGPSTTTMTPETTSTSLETQVVTDRGRLAVVDSSGNIVVMDPDGSNRQAVTNRGDNPVLYMQPVWSPDGARLAWGQRTGTGYGIGFGGPDSDETKTLTTPDLPFYTYWSPDGRYLGALHNGDSGVQFQIVDTVADTTELLDEDAPFYFSWSPSGDRVVTHAGVSRTQTLTPTGERVDLDPTSGTYLAPQWTPQGVLHVADDRLVLEDDEGDRTPVADVSGLTMFVANPEGTHVAVQTTGDGSPITASTEELPSVLSDRLVVVDVGTGRLETVEEALVVGFFWSPDGRSLLVLTTSRDRIVPKVWSLDGSERDFGAIQPSPALIRDTLPFFPQYAQSVSFWSPDSSAFALAGAVGGQDGIWIQSLAEETPIMVSDGSWVAWSPSRP